MSDASREKRSEAEAAIMRATYQALREHGYAELTMRAIASEYGKTTAAIHYHYETKDDLLVALLEYLLDRFVERVHGVETTAPAARLDALLDTLLVEVASERELAVALLELRAVAPYDEGVRDQLVRNDEYLRYLLRTVVVDGVERGVFDEGVDPESAAETLMTLVDGARTRFVLHDDPAVLHRAREAADRYVADALGA
ncbi:TetR/AcrR family transcriptional regulator [Halarchaeum sp. CBA1220]|uniref:TetR/AcrR family transcriptional regulator n=1 Tax=Halarchaeum sp. CBA1220 TaxID=1853682 RepID=UPI0021021D49|nr:TetR/AcrR family transcriptional regulator [Halarchaeum sp. CBA1220]